MDLILTPSETPYRMKILVVSGFLGSGKTTFIRSMVRGRQVKFCVLENEFADSSIDTAILQQEPGLDVVDVVSGCICCSSKNDLVTSVMTIFSSIRPDVLVIETTGVGLLSNVMATLRTIEHNSLEVLKPVSILDTNTVHGKLASQDMVFLDQIRSAGIVVLSKCETMPIEERMAISQKVRILNPTAISSLDHYSNQSSDWWCSLFNDQAKDDHVLTIEVPTWDSLSLKKIQLRNELELLRILENMSHGLFGNIQRAKGILPCGDHWLKFDFVGDRYSVSGFPGSTDSNVIFIGKFIFRDNLHRQFKCQSPLGLSMFQ